VLETQQAGHAFVLASEAVDKKFDLILAAGGDGTLNQVVNGILAGRESQDSLPTLGIIPLGTGNDFAKMCGVKADGKQLADLIQKASFKPTDAGKISCFDEAGNAQTKYFINVTSIGMGPEVVRRLSNSNRSLGPTLTYLKAITQTFFSHQPQPIFVQANDWEWRGQARVVAIANGKSFGNSLYIAPDAETRRWKVLNVHSRRSGTHEVFALPANHQEWKKT
jgi:Sphingosine kinase and enzymes related to eukaryotic diacylglycerol kinase